MNDKDMIKTLKEGLIEIKRQCAGLRIRRGSEWHYANPQTAKIFNIAERLLAEDLREAPQKVSATLCEATFNSKLEVYLNYIFDFLNSEGLEYFNYDFNPSKYIDTELKSSDLEYLVSNFERMVKEKDIPGLREWLSRVDCYLDNQSKKKDTAL